MRIAVIADIHGNLTALEAVLTDLEDAGADRMVCLGDVAATEWYAARRLVGEPLALSRSRHGTAYRAFR